MSTSDPGCPSVAVSDVHVMIDGRRILAGVDLHVDPGEVVGLMGPNGSGKSTLLDVIAGRRSPHRGDVRICGERVVHLSPRERARRGLGFVMQGGRVLSHLTVAEHLRLGMLGGGEEHAVPHALLSALTRGLQANDRTDMLDRAARLRLELAMVAATAPRILILDEPTAGLDRTERMRFVQDMATIRIAFPEMGVLVVEHDGALLTELAARVVRLEDGMIANRPATS